MGNALTQGEVNYPDGFLENIWNPDIKTMTNEKFTIDISFELARHGGTNRKMFRLRCLPNCQQVWFGNVEMTKPDYLWEPKNTNLHDFEVIDPFTKNEFRIPRSHGLGVLIVEGADLYVKFVYDPEHEGSVKPIISVWNHSDEAKKLLDKDMWLGYEICYISGLQCDIIHNMYHKRETDKFESKIFAPGFDTTLVAPASLASANIVENVTVNENCVKRTSRRSRSQDRIRDRSFSPKKVTRNHSRSRSRERVLKESTK